MANRAYQLQVRRYDLAAKLRCEIYRGMSSKAARTFVIKMGPADLRHDLELLGLAVENNFKVEKSKRQNWPGGNKRDSLLNTQTSQNSETAQIPQCMS